MYYFLDSFRDWLSMFFVFIILLVSIPVFIYSAGYMKEYKKHYSLGYFYTMLLLFITSMLGVVLSRDSISFMVFWELMSIASFFLVIYEYRGKDNLSSGIMYFIMTHISGLLLMVMFALLYRYTGSFDFQTISQLSSDFGYGQKVMIFVFAILGFGAKAGLVPLHAWLPKAHPSATSNVSALMSGVMLKVALYGFIRLSFFLAGGVPLACGIAVILLGTLTAVFSILNALFQEDIKKLLAYSSAENIGIIFAALGLSLVFANRSLGSLSMLALTAALFHILNHGVFKSLLFTGAGSVLYATGTRNMNELGGLHRKMRFAALCTLIGTAAIGAVPPLNGFASEILILKSFIVAGNSFHSLGLITTVIACGAILALTSGGAIFAAVKAFGITWLGDARSEKARNVHELPFSMNLGMGILSVLSILLGILSPFAVRIISDISAFTLNIKEYEMVETAGYEITIAAAVFVLVAILLSLLNGFLNRGKKVEIYETWGCGFDRLKSFMQYSGTGYTQPVGRIFGAAADYKKEVKSKASIHVRIRTVDLFEKYLYEPVVAFTHFISGKITKIHYGKIQLYVSYIFLSLIITIVVVMNFL